MRPRQISNNCPKGAWLIFVWGYFLLWLAWTWDLLDKIWHLRSGKEIFRTWSTSFSLGVDLCCWLWRSREEDLIIVHDYSSCPGGKWILLLHRQGRISLLVSPQNLYMLIDHPLVHIYAPVGPNCSQEETWGEWRAYRPQCEPSTMS